MIGALRHSKTHRETLYQARVAARPPMPEADGRRFTIMFTPPKGVEPTDLARCGITLEGALGIFEVRLLGRRCIATIDIQNHGSISFSGCTGHVLKVEPYYAPKPARKADKPMPARKFGAGKAP